MIGANQKIFKRLDSFCASSGFGLKNASSPRWIASKSTHRHFLTHAHMSMAANLGIEKKIARLDLLRKSYFVTIGFDNLEPMSNATQMSPDAGMVTVTLAELEPRPSASVDEIRNIVEYSDLNADAAYEGHEHEAIAALFPKMNVYQFDDLSDALTWNIFFRICLSECELSGVSWINGTLCNTLRVVCDLDLGKIPFKVLCRSIFDNDRSSFFLALYRCLEALYSFKGASALAKALQIEKDWADIAAALEDTLGWHPNEEGSLVSLMLQASSSRDILQILETLGETTEGDESERTCRAARRIYRLRNSIVHYRPAQHSIDLERIDWNRLCAALACAVVQVYGYVFRL